MSSSPAGGASPPGRPAGPPGGGGQLFLRQQVAERDPEGDPGLGQQPHGFGFGVPGGDAGFQPGDERPQLADRIGGPPAMAGDVGQPDDAGAPDGKSGDPHRLQRPAIPSPYRGGRCPLPRRANHAATDRL